MHLQTAVIFRSQALLSGKYCNFAKNYTFFMKLRNFNDIHNLLFDLGGVIMDIRRENCVEALAKLGMKGADEMLGLYCQSGPFLLLEEGKITPERFRDEMRKRIDHNIGDNELDNAFNKFLIGIPLKRLEALRELRKHYKIYMLSNTNPIMFDSKIKQEFEKEGFDRNYYFDGICVSFEEKCAKPDIQIFKNAALKFGIKPEETVFFDDSQANLNAASTLGFHTWLVKPGTEFTDAFK